MADYTNIPDTSLDIEAPVRSIDQKALRDNPLAIIEGAVDAPRLSIHALPRLTVGDTTRISQPDELTTTDTSFVTVYTFNSVQTGGVRVTFEHSRNSGSDINSVVQVLHNGVIVGSTDSAGGSWTEVTRDVTGLSPGSKVEIQQRRSGSSGTAGIRNIVFSTGGEDIWPGLPGFTFGSIPT